MKEHRNYHCYGNGDSISLINICPKSSKMLQRFNICGRKGEEKKGKKKIRERKENYFKDDKI